MMLATVQYGHGQNALVSDAYDQAMNGAAGDTQKACKFFLLGPFTVTDHQGKNVTPKSQKTCAMLAMLCLSPRSTRTRVWLRDKLWSERGEEQAAASLRQALLDARRCLSKISDNILVADKNFVSLNLNKIQLDIDDYLNDNPSGKSGSGEYSAIQREDLLEGMDVRDPEFEDWLTLERQIWERKANSLLTRVDQSQKLTAQRNSSNAEGAIGSSFMATIVAIRYAESRDPDRQDFDDCLTIVRDQLENRGGRIFQVGDSFVLVEFARVIDGVRFTTDLSNRFDVSSSLSFGVSTGLVKQEGHYIVGEEVDNAVAASRCAKGKQVVVTKAVSLSLSNIAHFHLSVLDSGNTSIKYHLLERRKTEAAVTSALSEVKGGAFSKTNEPTIAVLPFRAPQPTSQDYIGEGLADDVIVALSKNHWLSVISRNSSFVFDADSGDSADIAQALGADYIVSGTLKLSKSTVSVVITLENGQSNQIIYTEPFSVRLAEIMQLQEMLASRITARLLQELGKREQLRAYESRIDDLYTWQMVHRGNWHMSRRTAKGVEQAKAFYDQALTADPYQTDALLALAWWYVWHGWCQLGQPAAMECFKEAERLCRKAMLMDATEGNTHCYLGAIAIMRNRPQQALEYLDEAIRLNSSLTLGYASRGSAKLLLAKPEMAVEDLNVGLALNPADNYRFHTLAELASANFFSGDLLGAIDIAEDSNFLAPRYWYPRVIKIASHLQRGDTSSADLERNALFAQGINLRRENIESIPFQNREYNQILINALFQG